MRYLVTAFALCFCVATSYAQDTTEDTTAEEVVVVEEGDGDEVAVVNELVSFAKKGGCGCGKPKM